MKRKVKTGIRVSIRFLTDIASGTYFKFPGKNENLTQCPDAFIVTQEIKPSATFESKLYNLISASQKINQYTFLPGKIFSFWRIIGSPENAFRKSRSIVNGKLVEETGGGLCQVSGIIYHAALLAGLEVLERHNHSVDIYTDETRFTPLGTDAAVVYGYKDLRITNNLENPLKFQVSTHDNTITVGLQTTGILRQKSIRFSTRRRDGYVEVEIYDENNICLNRSEYIVDNKKP